MIAVMKWFLHEYLRGVRYEGALSLDEESCEDLSCIRPVHRVSRFLVPSPLDI